MKLHPERQQRLDHLAALDPETNWLEIYQRTVLWEFPAEARLGFQLAFYRPLAIPHMATVFYESGHMARSTVRRAYDTGLVLHEIIFGGVDSERGAKMVRLMNGLHNRAGVQQADLTYVLNALVVVPNRFIERTGWRPLTDNERSASWHFWAELGTRMGIDTLPTSYEHSEALLEQYEAAHLAPSKEGQALTAAVLEALRHRTPKPIRPFTAQMTSALLDEPEISAALGLPAPNPILTGSLRTALAVQRLRRRRSRPPEKPAFTPGQPAGSVYPHGYVLEQLGPPAH
jgi:hypothetical protein